MLVATLIAANLVTAAALALALRRLMIHRARRRQRNLFSRWPIPTVPAGEFAPALAAGPLGPGVRSEVVAIANYRVPGGISVGCSDSVHGHGEPELEAQQVQEHAQRKRRSTGIGDRVPVEYPDRRDRITLHLGEQHQSLRRVAAGERG